MGRTLLVFIIVTVSFIFHYGNATFSCPTPASTSLTYFDLKQLNMLAQDPNLANVFLSPLTCANGNDQDCTNQTCCPGEVGCCYSYQYTSSANQNNNCGCKMPGDKKCTHPAPLAIMAATLCTDHNKANTSACLRETRVDDGNFNFTNGQGTTQGEYTVPVVTSRYQMEQSMVTNWDDDDVNFMLQGLSADDLMNRLHNNVIEQLAEKIAVMKN